MESKQNVARKPKLCHVAMPEAWRSSRLSKSSDWYITPNALPPSVSNLDSMRRVRVIGTFAPRRCSSHQLASFGVYAVGRPTRPVKEEWKCIRCRSYTKQTHASGQHASYAPTQRTRQIFATFRTTARIWSLLLEYLRVRWYTSLTYTAYAIYCYLLPRMPRDMKRHLSLVTCYDRGHDRGGGMLSPRKVQGHTTGVLVLCLAFCVPSKRSTTSR